MAIWFGIANVIAIFGIAAYMVNSGLENAVSTIISKKESVANRYMDNVLDNVAKQQSEAATQLAQIHVKADDVRGDLEQLKVQIASHKAQIALTDATVQISQQKLDEFEEHVGPAARELTAITKPDSIEKSG